MRTTRSPVLLHGASSPRPPLETKALVPLCLGVTSDPCTPPPLPLLPGHNLNLLLTLHPRPQLHAHRISPIFDCKENTTTPTKTHTHTRKGGTFFCLCSLKVA